MIYVCYYLSIMPKYFEQVTQTGRKASTKNCEQVFTVTKDGN